MRRASLVLIALVLPLALDAQQRGGSPASRAERSGRARTIAGRDPQVIRAEYAAVLMQAERYDEAVREFRLLLETDPANSSWRLGLARAYAWGGRPRDAERELLRLRAEPRPLPAVVPLLRDVRTSMRVSPDEAAAWLAEEPGYAPYRLALARALVRARRAPAAIAHFDTLLAGGATAALLREAGAAHMAAGDTTGAIARVNASLALEPSVEGHLVLGDLHRWRGDTTSARLAYEAAQAVDATDRAVATALARLMREARPPVSVAGRTIDAPGWLVRAGSVTDNTGVGYSTLSLRRGSRLGATLGGEIRVGGGAELRRMEQRRAGTSAHGVAVDAGAEYERWYGSTGGRVTVRGGIALHEGLSVAPIGAVGAAIWVSAWELSFELEKAPAYPELLTMASLLEPDPRGGGPLAANSMSAAIAGPLGPADLALTIQQTDLADGNVRENVYGYARYAVRDRLAVLYSMTTVQAEEFSPLYWSPLDFMSHSVGVETAHRRRRGVSYAARALVGAALAEEHVMTGTGSSARLELTRGVAPQLSASAELVWRSAGWEVAASAGYGRGRAGDYERASAGLAIRLVP